MSGITITLTDEQALEIVSQVAAKLQGTKLQAAQPVMPSRTDAGATALARAHLMALKPGVMVRTTILANELNVPSQTVSYVLGDMKLLNQVEMVKRGTWRKL